MHVSMTCTGGGAELRNVRMAGCLSCRAESSRSLASPAAALNFPVGFLVLGPGRC
jgi:hypothetical protein